MKIKVITTMKYKKNSMFIGDWANPVLNHIPKEFSVYRAEITASGVCHIDGNRMEYQDIRVYLKDAAP